MVQAGTDEILAEIYQAESGDEESAYQMAATVEGMREGETGVGACTESTFLSNDAFRFTI